MMSSPRVASLETRSPADAIACAVCKHTVQPVLAVAGFPIFECADCHHRMTVAQLPAGHVAQVYGDDYFFAGGAGYPDYLADGKLLLQRGRWYARLLRHHRPQPGEVVDVGAAAGFILKGFQEQGWRCRGLEPNPTMSSFARESLGLNVETTILEAWEPDRRFDLILLLQVISHLTDPWSAMEKVSRFLAQAGQVLVETWDWRSWTARCLGRRWHQYSPPSVLHWFSSCSLQRLMGQFQLRLVASGRPRRRISWRHARSLISHRLSGRWLAQPFQAASRWLPPGMALPYPLDDLRWYLFARERHESQGEP